jgi:outer membrane protein assembly factor BamB
MGVDPGSGDILWTCRAPAAQSSVVFGEGLLYVDAGRYGQKGMAIDPTGMGDVSKTHVRWENRVEQASGSSALIVAGHIYRSSGQEFIRCWSLKDGALVHEVKAPRLTPSASPIATPDGRIYFAGPGRTYVISASPRFDVLATSDLNDGHNFTTPAVAGGRIYIKGRSHLWCIGIQQ